jgi:hypothetical protein
MIITDNELTQFFDWVYNEIVWEVNNPNTTITRDMKNAIVYHYSKSDKELDNDVLIDILCYNIVDEFMSGKSFAKCCSNLNLVLNDNRHSLKDMLLMLPINVIYHMQLAKKNRKKIKPSYTIHSYQKMINYSRSRRRP